MTCLTTASPRALPRGGERASGVQGGRGGGWWTPVDALVELCTESILNVHILDAPPSLPACLLACNCVQTRLGFPTSRWPLLSCLFLFFPYPLSFRLLSSLSAFLSRLVFIILIPFPILFSPVFPPTPRSLSLSPSSSSIPFPLSYPRLLVLQGHPRGKGGQTSNCKFLKGAAEAPRGS